jgi:hypothetical protein
MDVLDDDGGAAAVIAYLNIFLQGCCLSYFVFEIFFLGVTALSSEKSAESAPWPPADFWVLMGFCVFVELVFQRLT